MVKISKKSIGIIIVDEDNTPNPDEFSLVLTKTEDEFRLQKGMYVLVSTLEGDVIASVSNVYKTNRYFSSPSAVRAYETSGKTLASIFPADRWEHIIAKAKPLGILTEIGIQRLLYPVSPGETVYIPDNEILSKFLGLEKADGLNLGVINQHNINVNLNLTRFLQKHAAILAISGAGKSYTVSVIIEELLSRRKAQGRVAMVLMDIHGEFKGLGAEGSQLRKHVEIFPGAVIQFATPSLSSRQFTIYQPQITSAQTRELSKILSKMYHERVKKGETYVIKDIINELELDEQINVRSKEALIGWLFSLEETRLFGAAEYPSLQDILKPGKLVIFDLSEFTSLKLKQMIVSYILFRIFDLRKKNQVPPSTIIIEEAHQLCLSEDTEILTIDGWKKHFELAEGDLVYSYNKQNYMLITKPIEKIIRREFKGQMIHLQNEKSIDALLTPDHRVLCKTRTTSRKKTFRWSEMRFVEASDLPSSCKIPVVSRVNRKTSCDLDEDFIRILGWIISDGHKKTDANSKAFSYEICQSKSKGKIVEKMKRVIENNFENATVYLRKPRKGIADGRRFTSAESYTFHLGANASRDIETWLKDQTHRIPRDFLREASIEQLKILFEALIEGDGSVQLTKNKYIYRVFYAGLSKDLADDVQELCILIGLSAIVKKIKQKNQYKVLISEKRRYAHVRKTKLQSYEGLTWDITIQHGAFVARREGRVFITGNCPDARLELAISKSIIETIAREGRKFFTSLILVSQRPVKLSTTALSQCNTHVIMKILNPYDLDFIGRSSEGIDRATLNAITGLGVGEAVIVGNAVNHPIFVKIRERRTKTMETQSLEESAKSYDS